MMPEHPKIYHITHMENLPRILSQGKIWSDAKRIELGFDCTIVGMSEIKRRRLEELEVACHPGTRVGQYVPFYFCPRSIMLYILHRGNHPELQYKGGQSPIIHLEADLHDVVNRANLKGIRWAFSDANAGARYANFYASLDDLDKVNWTAVHQTDFRDAQIRNGKQAEFLVFNSFPWSSVDRVGVENGRISSQVEHALAGKSHQPPVNIQRSWYF